MVLLRIETKNTVCNPFAITERLVVDFERRTEKAGPDYREKVYFILMETLPPCTSSPPTLAPCKPRLFSGGNMPSSQTDNPVFNKIMICSK